MPLANSDLRALDRLVARYNNSWDTGDAQAWAATFTPDGTFSGLHGTYVGHADLTSYCAASTTGRSVGFPHLARQHWVSNMLFDGEGDTAIGRCYLMMVVRRADGSGAIDRVGWYDDECVRTPDGWRFSRRRVTEADTWPLDA